jgi:hypothetical protein
LPASASNSPPPASPSTEEFRPASFEPAPEAEEKPAPAATPSVAIKKARPAAAAVPSVAVKKIRPVRNVPPPAAPPKQPGPVAPEDDGAPYEMEGGPERRCPDCNKVMEADSVVCARCGFNLETGKKPRKVYEPVERTWEAGMPLRRRVTLFVASEVVVLLTGVLVARLTGSPALFLVPWLLFTGMLAFVLGTYDRVDLSRNTRGKVFLSKTWRICFRPLAPVSIKVIEYEAVVTGAVHETDFWDWILFLTLFSFGVLPGLWWYIYGMSQDTYFVALARDHGYPETVLYRGWNEKHMQDIANTLREVAEMP